MVYDEVGGIFLQLQLSVRQNRESVYLQHT